MLWSYDMIKARQLCMSSWNCHKIDSNCLVSHIVFLNSFPRDLIAGLLTVDRTKRYGCMKNAAEDIKNHAWFTSIQWDEVRHRSLKVKKKDI